MSTRSSIHTRKPEIKSSQATTAAAAAPASALACPAEMAVPVRRIVTFHMNGLGDLLFTLPSLHALRESFPGAAITAVVPAPFLPLLQGSPLIDRLLPRPKGSVSQQARMLKRLHDSHFDMAFAFSGTRKTALQIWATGAPVRVGYTTAKMEALLTHHVEIEGPPRIETHLELVQVAGGRPHQPDYRGLLFLEPEYSQRAQALLDEHNISGPFLIAACAASDKRGIKEWPASHWAAAIEQLSARWPVVLVGTKTTPEVTQNLASAAQPVVDLGGRTDLPTLAALCGKAALFCGIDSGVMHLAATMETPVVGIFGPSDWRLTGPSGVPHRIVRHPVECSPCLLAHCKWTGEDERKCLTRLASEAVVQAVQELIGV